MTESSWARMMADSTMRANPELRGGWECYPIGVALKGIEAVWRSCREAKYLDYIQRNIDLMVSPSGEIPGFRPGTENIDHINNGKIVLALFRETKEPRYAKAARFLMGQLERHPRTSEGGFWHKRIYPHQMWLDGIYMGSPFYAEYASLFGGGSGFDDVARQIVLMNGHARDPVSGLLYHGWDESRSQLWADPKTGLSPNFWGRAMGWYAMAIVDVMDTLPADHPARGAIAGIFNDMAEALARVRDEGSGLWYQVLDQGGREGNYLEASASAMFSYAFLKAARLGFAREGVREMGLAAFRGMTERFIETDAEGFIHIKDTCMVAGLGSFGPNCPYRDGSYEYYIGEPRMVDDLKGVGAFILAASEAESP
ncbi:MAG: glycoside hydrolase family 88 protein [Spirochaetaceae bacterium]|nr:glycoside hydrolase family 88 protein [Spirochaetaceae bacterium]